MEQIKMIQTTNQQANCGNYFRIYSYLERERDSKEMHLSEVRLCIYVHTYIYGYVVMRCIVLCIMGWYSTNGLGMEQSSRCFMGSTWRFIQRIQGKILILPWLRTMPVKFPPCIQALQKSHVGLFRQPYVSREYLKISPQTSTLSKHM